MQTNSIFINHNIENESSIENSIYKNDMQLTQTQKCCCNNKFILPNNRLTIKQFIQSYTNFSKFEFDAHQSLKWPSFTKSRQISSKMDIFDVKDAFATFVETIGHQETKNDSENKSCFFNAIIVIGLLQHLSSRTI